MKLLIHHAPASVSQEKIISIGEINSPQFDFAEHFEKEAFAKLGRFLVCYKAKPWMSHDLMIIDSADDYARSIADLGDSDRNQLAQIIQASVEQLKFDQDVAKIVVGANINYLSEKEDHESVLRLHVHVCGLTHQELSNMEPLEENLPIFNDEIISRFKSAFENRQDIETYIYGIRRDLTGLDYAELVDAINDLDEKTQEVLKQLSQDFSVVSYSFALLIEGGASMLFISPKSNDGRGVLEAIGIILSRDDELEVSDHFISERNRFLNQIQSALTDELGAEKGKLKLEER